MNVNDRDPSAPNQVSVMAKTSSERSSTQSRTSNGVLRKDLNIAFIKANFPRRSGEVR